MIKIRLYKKLSLLLLSALLITAGCSTDSAFEESGIIEDGDNIVAYDFEPITFYSFIDFENAIYSDKTDNDIYDISSISYYYLPSEYFNNLYLDAITVKQRYVCLYYYLEDLTGKFFDSVDEEEIARINNTVKLEWIRNEIGDDLLKNTVSQLSLSEYDNDIYYYDIVYPTEPDDILAKSFYWVKDGFMFNMDIPQNLFNILIEQGYSIDDIIDITKKEI